MTAANEYGGEWEDEVQAISGLFFGTTDGGQPVFGGDIRNG